MKQVDPARSLEIPKFVLTIDILNEWKFHMTTGLSLSFPFPSFNKISEKVSPRSA